MAPETSDVLLQLLCLSDLVWPFGRDLAGGWNVCDLHMPFVEVRYSGVIPGDLIAWPCDVIYWPCCGWPWLASCGMTFHDLEVLMSTIWKCCLVMNDLDDLALVQCVTFIQLWISMWLHGVLTSWAYDYWKWKDKLTLEQVWFHITSSVSIVLLKVSTTDLHDFEFGVVHISDYTGTDLKLHCVSEQFFNYLTVISCIQFSSAFEKLW